MDSAGVSTPERRLLVPTLVLLTTVTSIVSSLGAPLVPALAAESGVSVGTAQWSLTATLLMGAVSTPILGRLGGNRRRRRVILAGLGLVTLGAALAALPLGLGWLLAGRTLQGIGMGLTPLAFAVAREFVPHEKVTSTIALLSVSTVVGAGLGYPVTATIADRLGIAAAFWFGFAVCAATLVLTLVVVPTSRSTAEDRVDWLGAALLASGTAAVLVAVSQGDPWGWTSPEVLGLVAAAVVLLSSWVWRTLSVSHPLVDLRLAARRATVAANVTALSGGLAAYLLISMVMLQAQAPQSSYGLGGSVTTAGLLLVPYSLTSMLGNRLTAYLARRVLPGLILPIGCAVYLLATVGLAFWHEQVWQVAVVMAVAGIGSGCTFAAMPGLIVRGLPAEETGSATAFNMVLRFLGFSSGSALAVALLEVFAVDGQVVDGSFTAVALVGAAVWLTTGVLSLGLALRGAGPVTRRG